ncbi:MAG: PAS domain-containing sensor histidine kinase [Cytophagaceae bacterium]
MGLSQTYHDSKWMTDLLENLGHGIVILNEKLDVTFINNKAALLLESDSTVLSPDLKSICRFIKENQHAYKVVSSSFRYTTFSTNSKIELLVKTQPLLSDLRLFKGCFILVKEVFNFDTLSKQLDLAETKYKFLFENTTDGVLLFNDDTVIIGANTSAEKIYSFKQPNLVNKTIADLFPHHSNEVFVEIVETFFKEGRLSSFYKFIRPNGQPVYIDFSAQAHILPGVHMAIFKDLTNSILLNKAFKQTESNLQTLFQNSSHAIFLFDQKDQMISMNDKAVSYLKLRSIENLEPQSTFFQSNILPISLNKASEKLALMKEGEVVLEQYTFINDVNNQQLWFEYSLIPFLNEKRKILNYCLTIQDITDKKNVEKELIESETKFRNLTEYSPNIIYIVDFKNRAFPYFNRSEILGYNISQLQTFEFWDSIFHPEDEHRMRDHFTQFIRHKKGNSSGIDLRLKDSKGVYQWVHNRHSVLEMTPEGFVSKAIVNLTIITDQKKQEEDIKRTNFELDSFVYRASHDLRAPLKSVLGLVSLAFKEKDDTERARYLGMVEKSVLRLDNFIEDLTNFSRNNRLSITPREIYFEDIVEHSWENLKYMDTHSNVKIELDIKYRYSFYSDDNRLTIIFQNLLSNAIKYRNSNLSVSVINIRIRSMKEGVLIEIQDNGIGIKQEYLDKIFDMFFRASHDSNGSGLGLYITRQVVEKLGGTIDVESTYGEGTKFEIYLPNLMTDRKI